VFASEREAIERGCELIAEGIWIITVTPFKGDPLGGLFFPLDAEGSQTASVLPLPAIGSPFSRPPTLLARRSAENGRGRAF